jgi:hypothetical protein
MVVAILSGDRPVRTVAICRTSAVNDRAPF